MASLGRAAVVLVQRVERMTGPLVGRRHNILCAPPAGPCVITSLWMASASERATGRRSLRAWAAVRSAPDEGDPFDVAPLAGWSRRRSSSAFATGADGGFDAGRQRRQSAQGLQAARLWSGRSSSRRGRKAPANARISLTPRCAGFRPVCTGGFGLLRPVRTECPRQVQRVPIAGRTRPRLVVQLHRIAARYPIRGAFRAPPWPRNGRSSPARGPSSAAAIRARAARSDGWPYVLITSAPPSVCPSCTATSAGARPSSSRYVAQK
jgi:hypothetical protein